nr:glycoside hydrolase family 3 C-terminal domain-containing protein [Bacteroidota bacterium]
VMACVKHFALYGAGEAGRDYNPVDMSKIKMFQYYLPPYKAALDAGAGSIMTSFNEINGVPASGDPWLLNELLRNQWGYEGLVVSDYTSLNELKEHGVAKDEVEVAAMTLKSSVDMDMVGEVFLNNLKKLTDENKISVAEIDKACRRILVTKYKLGLFENPYKYADQKRSDKVFKDVAFRNAARDIARKSMVLLKNQKGVLPLKKTGSIALIGPLAKNKRDMIGSWSAAGDWKQAISVDQGIKNVAGNAVTINYAKGANFTNNKLIIDKLNAHGGELEIDTRSPEAMIQEAVATANKSDVVVAVLGESQGMSGEAASRSDITNSTWQSAGPVKSLESYWKANSFGFNEWQTSCHHLGK